MKFSGFTMRLSLLFGAGLCAGLAAACATGGGETAAGSGGQSSGTGAATGTSTTGPGATTTSSSGGNGQCTPCVTTPACGTGSDCAQFAGDTYCAVDCTNGGKCPLDTACTAVNTAEGHAVSVCVPVTNPCGGRMSGSSSTSAAVTSTTTTTTGSSGSCAHSPCAAGVALTSACDPCAAAVCMGDAYCCNNKWDSQCVSEAMSACGPSCSGGASTSASTSTTSTTSTSSGGSCAHSPCTSGASLTDGCDACVSTVCAGDSYCCKNKWDSQCVTEAMSACGGSCSGGTSTSTSTSTTSTSSTSSTSSSSSGGIGPGGGTLSTLSFAIVGDTRPASIDDTSGYPTSIITQIWKDVEAQSPRPAFAVTTGDYMFASTSGGQAAPQLQLYLGARGNFTNTVFPTMGNHECTGATASNCGPGNKDGITDNYTQFMTKMLGQLNETKPYYTINVNGTNNAWTAKFVFVACNAWDSTQASWLSSQLSTSTTYTFVVRHEGTNATTAPCLSGSSNADTIISQHPHTLLIAGHTHTYAYYSSEKQVIVGNGGAPITGSVNYGYVIARQQSNGSIVFTEYDYQTNAATSSFTVQ